MTKTRSPEYPAISLGEAIDKVKVIYEKDYQNKLSKEVIAEHLGYKSLSGASLPILSALNKYGLLEGRGNETHVSDLALHIVAHEPGSSERMTAIQTAATNPELFLDLARHFQNGKASDSAIRAYLLMRKFIPSAADTAIRTYRETNQLVEAEQEAYAKANPEAMRQVEFDEMMQDANERGQLFSPAAQAPPPRSKTPAPSMEEPTRPGTRKEIIALDEGDVIITFPENLSADSFGDLQAYLDLFIKKMQRRAKGSQKDEAAN
ncbi:MAG: hypothetical protein ACLPN5_07380 [Roseiarcus sp.]